METVPGSVGYSNPLQATAAKGSPLLLKMVGTVGFQGFRLCLPEFWSLRFGSRLLGLRLRV